MTQLDKLFRLNEWLLNDMPQYKSQAAHFGTDKNSQWNLFRSLVNIRNPKPISKDFEAIQNSFLQEEIRQKGITELKQLTPIYGNIYLWKGDITTFQRLIHDVEAGTVNCIICKTLSRAFRNYSDQGYFLEKVFPLYGVRFISISDSSLNTFKNPDAVQGMEVPITGLMNDRYAARTSNRPYAGRSTPSAGKANLSAHLPLMGT